MSQDSSAYLTDKCEVRNRDVTGGKSVIAREHIDPGELIGVWSGRVVSTEELEGLAPEIRMHTVQVEEELYLASIGDSEPPDYINHSCDPNAGLDGQIAIVAMRDIEPGDEVTIDYAMCDGSPYDEFDCACGTALCRGRVTGRGLARPGAVEALPGSFLALSATPHRGTSTRAGPAPPAPPSKRAGAGAHGMSEPAGSPPAGAAFWPRPNHSTHTLKQRERR